MNLIPLIDVQPDDEASVLMFLDSNALMHETIFDELLRGGVVLPHYPLWSDGGFNADWLDVHYREHLSLSLELEIPLPPIISGVDFDSADQARDWINNHYLHHALIAAALAL